MSLALVAAVGVVANGVVAQVLAYMVARNAHKALSETLAAATPPA